MFEDMTFNCTFLKIYFTREVKHFIGLTEDIIPTQW